MRFPLACATALLLLFAEPLCTFAEPVSDETTSSTSVSPGWRRLFNGKTFDGWYIWLERQKKNEDPARVFQIHDGVIHVYKDLADGTDAAKGYLATESEYSDYGLRLEFKWGEKKFRPRLNQPRDAGLLYHMRPPDVVWPRCLECQIQENDVGDFFNVRGTRVVASVEIADVETPTGRKKLPRYKPEAVGGTSQIVGDGSITRIVKSDTHERDGWNSIEVLVKGGEQAVHIINGHTVFAAKDLRQLGTSPNLTPIAATEAEKRKWVPLASGRIALQAEYAEVFYRNIEIRPFPTGAGSK